MSDLIRVGIAGARRGRAFVTGLRAIPGVEVTALCDIDADFLAEQADAHGIPGRFLDYTDLLNTDIDLVIVATPMQLHVPQSLAALAAGKHVMSEVTAAVSIEQCKELLEGVEAAKASGLKYMMAENVTYFRDNVVIQNMVEQGLFGDIYYAEGQYIHNLKNLRSAIPYSNADGSPTWRARWLTGVNGCTYATHPIGPLLEWFQAKVDSVVCLGTGRHTVPEQVAEDSTTMLCKTDSGALLNIRVDILSNGPHSPRQNYHALQGTKGCFEAARGLGDKPKIWLDRLEAGASGHENIDTDPYQLYGWDYGQNTRGVGTKEITFAWRPLEDLADEFLPEMWRNPPPAALAAGHHGSDYFIVKDIIDAIREDKEPRIDVYRALDYTLPGLMSAKSIALGGMPVKVPDFRSGQWE